MASPRRAETVQRHGAAKMKAASAPSSSVSHRSMYRALFTIRPMASRNASLQATCKHQQTPRLSDRGGQRCARSAHVDSQFDDIRQTGNAATATSVPTAQGTQQRVCDRLPNRQAALGRPTLSCEAQACVNLRSLFKACNNRCSQLDRCSCPS